MRSVVVEEQGGPEVLRIVEGPPPEPGPGQVVVDVRAAGVNFLDVQQRSGTYRMRTPFGLGSEGACTPASVASAALSRVETVPMTRPPARRTIWTSSKPVPPAAACTRTSTPGHARPLRAGQRTGRTGGSATARQGLALPDPPGADRPHRHP